ncbi:Acyl-coenzyme A synthetase ACSM3, mitochondrial [Nymphon striatum]|nr:Acyl-coenzyme A synthetase ACSM3, mitochondrial [Nymphon striatum]
MHCLSKNIVLKILTPVLGRFQRQAIRLCGCNGVDFKGVNLGPKPSKTGFNDYDVGRQECESLKVPEKFNFARDVVDCWAAKESKGERCNSLPAYWYVSSNGNEIKWSFNELSALSKRAANVLEECGIIKGDILLVTLPKVPEWWLLYLASIRIGAIFCTGTSMLTAEDIKYRIETSKSKCVVCNEETFSAVSQGVKMCSDEITKIFISNKLEHRPSWINFNDLFYKTSSSQHECVDSDSNEPMTYFFTSGTTGKPKIVEHTHASYGFGHQITAKYWLDLTKDDTILSLSDPGWAKAAWSNFFAPWYNGSCIFIDGVGKFCPERILSVLEKYPINVFCASPTAYRMMVQKDIEKYKFSHLRHCLSAGEPLNPAIFKLWYNKTGLMLREGFGQSETLISYHSLRQDGRHSHVTFIATACLGAKELGRYGFGRAVIQCGMFQCLPLKLGSMGKPAPGVNIQVIDNKGNEVERGTEGEVGIRIKPNRPIGLFTHYAVSYS